MEEDQRDIAERTFGKGIERTRKADEHLALLNEVIADLQRPKKIRDEAKDLRDKWNAARNLPEQNRIKKQNELYPLMVKFRNENQ